MRALSRKSFFCTTCLAAALALPLAAQAQTTGPIGNRIGTQTYVTGNQEDLEAFEKTVRMAAQDLRMKSMRFDMKFFAYVKWDNKLQRPYYEPEEMRKSLDRIGACITNGVTPILIFSTYHHEMPDALFGKDGTVGWPTDEYTIDAYANWVADTATLIRLKYPKLKIIMQLGNEITGNTEWKDPKKRAAYAQLVKSTRICLDKKNLKNTELLLGSVSLGQYQQMQADDFFEHYVARNQLNRYVDGYTIHSYSGSPQLAWAPESEYELGVKTVLAMHDKLFYVTEGGFTSRGQAEETQPAYDLRHFFMSLAFGAKGFTLYEAVDRYKNDEPHNETPGTEQFFGMIDKDGKIKPSGFAVQKFLKEYGDHSFVSYGPIKNEPHHFQMVLKSPEGKRVYFRWAMTDADVTPEFSIMPRAFSHAYSPEHKMDNVNFSAPVRTSAEFLLNNFRDSLAFAVQPQ